MRLETVSRAQEKAVIPNRFGGKGKIRRKREIDRNRLGNLAGYTGYYEKAQEESNTRW